MKIRVSFIASTLTVGGAEHVTFELLTRLPADRFQCELLVLRDPGPVGERLQRAGVKVTSGLQHHRGDPLALFRIAKQLRAFKPDILFSLDHHNAIFWGGLASLLAGVPHRAVVSHSTGKMNGQRSFKRSDHWLFRYTDSVIGLSPLHVDYLRDVEGIESNKLVALENGIDTTRFANVDEQDVERARNELNIPAQSRVVIMVAALRPEKAHDVVIDAAANLRATQPDLHVLFVGDGPQRDTLMARCDDKGVSDIVHFAGRRDDVAVLLRMADVMVLPSHPAVETQPLAVLEAMASGVPVIASRVGSVPDMIDDGNNGRLIDPAHREQLENALRMHFADSSAAQNMAKSARATVEQRFTVDDMVERYARHFEALAAPPP